jgi:PHD/YefM family antitoxin component YafN of YafNO toxin-antitoxin module
MTAIKGTTLKTDFKSICDRAYHGESFIITRPREQNVVLISEREYQMLLRIKSYIINTQKQSEISAEQTYPDHFFDLFGSCHEDMSILESL